MCRNCFNESASRESNVENAPGKTRPSVSVIVPVFNAGVYLGRCIESLRAQTYEPIELVFVDDGSTDDSPAVLDRYQECDQRIVVMHQRNAGPGAARNAGMDRARGDYLYFFDADDFCEANLIEVVMDRLLETDADMAVFPFKEYSQLAGVAQRPTWGLLGDKFPRDVFSWRDNPDWIFEAFQNYPWNKIVKASFLRSHGIRYQEDVYLTEDLMYAAPCLALADKIAWIDASLVYHRISTGTNVMANKDAHPLDFIRAFSVFKSFLEDRGLYDDLRVAYVNWALNACLYNLHTLNTFEGFGLVFDTLARTGLSQLGLADVDDDDIRAEAYRTLLKALREGDAAAYAYRLYVYACDDRDYLDFLARFRLAEMGRLEGELRECHKDADRAISAERGRLRELDEEFADYRRMHESVMNAAEQRIGGLICYIPRLIQRKVIGARGKKRS